MFKGSVIVSGQTTKTIIMILSIALIILAVDQVKHVSAIEVNLEKRAESSIGKSITQSISNNYSVATSAIAKQGGTTTGTQNTSDFMFFTSRNPWVIPVIFIAIGTIVIICVTINIYRRYYSNQRSRKHRLNNSQGNQQKSAGLKSNMSGAVGQPSNQESFQQQQQARQQQTQQPKAKAQNAYASNAELLVTSSASAIPREKSQNNLQKNAFRVSDASTNDTKNPPATALSPPQQAAIDIDRKSGAYDTKQPVIMDRKGVPLSDIQALATTTQRPLINLDAPAKESDKLDLSEFTAQGSTVIISGQNSTTSNTHGDGTTLSSNALVLPAYKLMNIKDVEITKDIGEGGFATIQMGILKNTAISRRYGCERVAVKVIKITGDEQEDELSKSSFLQEIAIIELFQKNENFIQLIGFCDKPLAAIFRFYPYGTFDDHLIGQKSHRLVQYSIEFVVYILYDIANAFRALHLAGISHCDLKPANVLLNFNAKYRPIGILCDFGMANIVNKKLMGVKAFKDVDQRGGSLFYLAPEMFEGDVDVQALMPVDIYAYGIMAYCGLTRYKPWNEMGKKPYVKMIRTANRPPFNAKAIWNEFTEHPFKNDLIAFVEKCWAQAGNDRIPFSKIYDILAALGQKMNLEL